MKLEEIGFYTLTDKRAKNISATSPMSRCEMILTDKCNFKCPYCRGLRKDCLGEMPTDKAKEITNIWALDGLKNIRYSGGEPTLHPGLIDIVKNAKNKIKRIALSTNGSAPLELYKDLIKAGVNDFSISLDACCSSFADKMSGVNGQFDIVVSNIKELSKLTYVTIGVVLTEDNVHLVKDIVEFSDQLGVSDIRIISAAQYNKLLDGVLQIKESILNKYPILRYRVNNIKKGRNVRGMKEIDCNKCYLVKDDSVVSGNYHFPCVIYMREKGNPIGKISNDMRRERIGWFEKHNSFEDEICRGNCLDVCIDFNNRCKELKENNWMNIK
ncbi:MAG: radical SAM protein [Nanoarchaeota archaeon]